MSKFSETYVLQVAVKEFILEQKILKTICNPVKIWIYLQSCDDGVAQICCILISCFSRFISKLETSMLFKMVFNSLKFENWKLKVQIVDKSQFKCWQAGCAITFDIFGQVGDFLEFFK